MAKTLVLATILAICLVSLVSAQASPPLISNVFGDNMVIRANSSSTIWGWTEDSTTTVMVSVVRDGKVQAFWFAISNDHFWSVGIQYPEENRPSSIVVETRAGKYQQAVLKNVLFGWVFICGGQSNMAMSVPAVFNASYEISQADRYPDIRLFTVGQNTYSSSPLKQFENIVQPWTVASAAAIGKSEWTYFSATCWFFARDLYQKEKKPIGLVSSNWGGTYIQTWSSPDVAKKCAASPTQPPQKAPNQPSLLYNSMLNPLFGMGIDGILWYQGESNIGYADTYSCYFPEMIHDWRLRQEPMFGAVPFFFVQLAPYTAGITPQNHFNLAELRNAQMSGFTQFGVSGVTAIDAGDGGDIHPRNKQILGKRLASAFMRSQRGIFGYEGPIFSYAYFNASDEYVYANFQTTMDLVLVPATCPPGVDPVYCSAFQLQGSDGKWRDATPRLLPATDKTSRDIVLSAPVPSSGGTHIGIRYAYNAWPLSVLYDTNQYPAWPFIKSLIPDEKRRKP